MRFNVGAIVGVVEHGIEKIWPGIVTHVDAELHKVTKFSDAGSTILHDVEGAADVAAARGLDTTTTHVIVPADELAPVDDDPADELAAVDEPTGMDAPNGEPIVAKPAAKATAKKAAA